MKERPSHHSFLHHVITALKTPRILQAKSDLDCALFPKLNMALEF